MKYCVVLYCPQKGPSDMYGNKVTYHKVPANEPQRTLWIKKIRRRDYLYNPVANIYVCSLHFDETDFMKGVANNQRRLCDGSVPSKFQWQPFEDWETVPVRIKSEVVEVELPSLTNMESTAEKSTYTAIPEVFKQEECLHVFENERFDRMEFQDVKNTIDKEPVFSSENDALILENERLEKLVADLTRKLKRKAERTNLIEFKLKEAERLLKEERIKCRNLETKLKKRFGIGFGIDKIDNK